jgi:hypothetical protein
MESSILDLAKDKKIADFANVVKDEIRKKVLNTEYVQDKSNEIDNYSEVTKTMKKINGVDKSEENDKPVETEVEIKDNEVNAEES